MTDALIIDDLVVRYGTTRAVDGIRMICEAGQVHAIIGPNGAGKTSIIETCEGYRLPASGKVRVLGLDPYADASALRPRVGVMLQDGGVPSGARVHDALSHMASFYKHPLNPRALAERLGIASVEAPYRRMSGGEQQRLKFAIALIGRPEFVFLDEPTAGMDAQAKRIVWEMVAELRSHGVTIVLSTHLMDDVERLADQLVVINSGRIAAMGTPDELLQSAAFALTFSGPIGLDIDSMLAALPRGAEAIESAPGSYVITVATGPEALAALTAWCAAQGFMPRELATGRRRLEDFIVDLAAGEVRS